MQRRAFDLLLARIPKSSQNLIKKAEHHGIIKHL